MKGRELVKRLARKLEVSLDNPKLKSKIRLEPLQRTRDAHMRSILGPKLQTWFGQVFRGKDCSLDYEGGGSKMKDRPHNEKTLFGGGIFPDAWIQKPYRIAVEIDYGDGNKLKSALGKAGFLPLTCYDYCILIFFMDNGDVSELQLDEAYEQNVRAKYWKNFKTWVIVKQL